ncbi:hypothetical protein ACRAWF_01415 [Streptomyces sp. L7]
MSQSTPFPAGRPVVLRGGTVLPMDRTRRVLSDYRRARDGRPDHRGRPAARRAGGDRGDRRVRRHRDARHDRHCTGTCGRRRCAATAPSWTLTQYFVWYYLEHGTAFRPEDVHAGNLLAAVEALDAGVTTVVDWSHGLQTVDHADAAVDALQAVPGRFVLAYGNIQQAPAEWTAAPQFRDFVRRRITGDDMLGFQDRLRRHRRSAFPEKPAFGGRPRPRRRRHHPRRSLGRHQRRRHPALCTSTAS